MAGSRLLASFAYPDELSDSDDSGQGQAVSLAAPAPRVMTVLESIARGTDDEPAAVPASDSARGADGSGSAAQAAQHAAEEPLVTAQAFKSDVVANGSRLGAGGTGVVRGHAA